MAGAGVLYILFGIMAFCGIPGGHEDHHHTFAHNLTHIVLGSALLVFTFCCRAAMRKIVCFSFGAGYFAIAIIGAMMGAPSSLPLLPGVLEFHAGDYLVHFATGVVFVGLGLIRRSDSRPLPTT